MEELKIKNYNYSGDEQYQPPMDGISYGNSRVFPYLPDPALIKAVNLAIALEQPLLLEGEPGCGKTWFGWCDLSRIHSTLSSQVKGPQKSKMALLRLGY